MNLKKNIHPRRRATYLFRLLFVAVCVLVLIGIVRSFAGVIQESYGTAEATKEPVHLFEDTIDAIDKNNRQRQKDYEDGKAAMGEDSEEILNEDDVDSGDDNLICHDYYDASGRLLWKGLSLEEAQNADSATKKKFQKALKKYEKSTSEATEDTKLTMSGNQTPAERLQNLCLEYDEKIPYAKDTFNYYLGFQKVDAYDNTPFLKEGQNGYGMGSLGYVTWCYRNSLGYTPKALKGELFHAKDAVKIDLSELKTGDLCVIDQNNGKLYGVVCGTYKENIVLSLCDAYSTQDFQAGCVHMAYVKQLHDEFLGYYPSVKASAAYRLKEMEEK